MQVQKFQITPGIPIQKVFMPQGSMLLTGIHKIDDNFYLYAICESKNPNIPRELRVYPTFQEINIDSGIMYVGTFHDYVQGYHVFELESPEHPGDIEQTSQ